MPNISADEFRKLTRSASRLRHVSVLGLADHGKSTVCTMLRDAAEIRITNDSAMDLEAGENRREFSPQTVATPLLFSDDKDDDGTKPYLVNIIDTPRSYDDFDGSSVAASLRVADGALIVVDSVECAVVPDAALKQCFASRVVPCAFIGKVDRLIRELALEPEEVYGCFGRIIDKLNESLAVFACDPAFANSGNVRCDGDCGGNGVSNPSQSFLCPIRGNVVFGCGLKNGAWAFSVTQFARMYTAKFGVDEKKMASKLWGDSFFDHKAKKWLSTNVNENGENLRRGFSCFCIEPIYQIHDAVMNSKTEKLTKILAAIKVTLSAEECSLAEQQSPSQLFKLIMMKFLPAADTILQMIVTHLPSPAKAQTYRAEMLYSGEPTMEDKYFAGIKMCDPSAPLVMYVSRLMPAPNTVIAEAGLDHSTSRLYAFGRIFSGKVRSGQKVRIMGNNYSHGKKLDLYEDKPVGRIMFMMGFHAPVVVVDDSDTDGDVHCGNVIGIIGGAEKYIAKSATLAESANEEEIGNNAPSSAAAACRPIRDVPFSIAPVVKVFVDVASPTDLRALVEGLKRLAQSDPLAMCSVEPTGEHVVAGVNEAHLSMCIRELRDHFVGDWVRLTVSEPAVTFRETVTSASRTQCMTKSANRHNRLLARASPLSDALCCAIEDEAGMVHGSEMIGGGGGGGASTTSTNVRHSTVGFARRDRVALGLTEATVGPSATNAAERARILVETYGWRSDSEGAPPSIWAYGPCSKGANILDCTARGAEVLSSIQAVRPSIVAGWSFAMQEGPLCEEEMRGVRLSIEDSYFSAAFFNRTSQGQIMPMVRRLTVGAVLSATPRLLQPAFNVAITLVQPSFRCEHSTIDSNESDIETIGRIFEKRCGHLISHHTRSDLGLRHTAASSIMHVQGHLPVPEAFGIEAELRSATNGRVISARCSFDRWEPFGGDPLDEDSEAHKLIAAIRERKGMRIPELSDLLDTL